MFSEIMYCIHTHRKSSFVPVEHEIEQFQKQKLMSCSAQRRLKGGWQRREADNQTGSAVRSANKKPYPGEECNV